MLQHLAVLLLSFALCQAHIVHLRLQEAEELPSGFGQSIFLSNEGQQILPKLQSSAEEMPAMGLPLFGMSRTTDGNWDSWMDSQFDALNSMNQALLGGRRSGCGGHMHQQSIAPIMIRGVPTMTTPSVVMQRLASARFGNDILKALIESQMEADGAWGTEASPDLAAAAMELAEPQFQAFESFNGKMGDSLEAGSESGEAAVQYVLEDDFEPGREGLPENERLLNQADEDEEAEAEADATEFDPRDWASFLPTWITAPEDQELMGDASASDSSINWSMQNKDGTTNWGLIVFILQAAACISVWAGLMLTMGYYRFARRAAKKCRRAAKNCRRFASSADSHLVTPLMYESHAKADQNAQLYGDLYPVEDAKLHADKDDRQYVSIQYVPLKSEGL